MIGRLTGILLEKQAPNLLIDVNGVGYDVIAPVTTFYSLANIGERVVLHTHFSVSENSQQLFGFIALPDRELFRMLIKVNGVGPKLAVSIMSMETSDFARCVVDSNLAALVKLPGVGKKTAERLLVDMRDKMQDWVDSHGLGGSSTVQGDIISSGSSVNPNKLNDEAQSALVALGYKPVEASKAVARAMKDDIVSSEELIRAALKGMM